MEISLRGRILDCSSRAAPAVDVLDGDCGTPSRAETSDRSKARAAQSSVTADPLGATIEFSLQYHA
jgi:hypothetical protein